MATDLIVTPDHAQASETSRPVTVVDADVHPMPRRFADLRQYIPKKYLSQGWLEQLEVDKGVYTVPTTTGGVRSDSLPENSPAGSDPDLLEQQLFEQAGVDIAIMFPLPITGLANLEHETALLSATNAWLVDTWLTQFNKAGRFKGTVSVVAARPDLAVAEIEKWGEHTDVVQVLMDPYQSSPLGQSQYYPIYEAAEALGLPVALHVRRTPGQRLLTPVGFLSYYAELHPLYTMPYLAHLVSMVMEGVFEKFPRLKFVLVEGGLAWAAPLMWRLDNYWKVYGAEVPWLTRPPSAYIREHVRFTTQPIEEPRRPEHLRSMIEWMDGGGTLLFSSDYPHWDFDDPKWVIKRLPKDIRKRVLCENAIELYGLPTTLAVEGT